jgi:hypothetical protein
MTELITWAFSPLNCLFTVLLISIVLYWVTVILGVLDTDLFDVELPDPGLEIDVDADVDLEADADLDTGVVWGVAHWFYVGEVPVMVLVSILILSLWTCNMLGNYYFNNPEAEWGRGFVVLGANLVISLGVVKVVAAPLRPVYALFNKDYNAPKKVLGRIGRVSTTEVTDKKMGQVEVTTKGAPIVLNVRAQKGHQFKRDDEAVIVGKDEQASVYLISPTDLENKNA